MKGSADGARFGAALALAALLLAKGCGTGGSEESGGLPPPGGGPDGATALVSWDANTEPDLAGYRVYHGLASRRYGPPVDVGSTATSATVGSLQPGLGYYFAVTAYDLAGNESGYSDEVFKVVE